ncbi:MAG: TonB-dependent receptor, partial [Prolixibacteraceae bacterium]|nr:TonB-dependent receptor [Prolixibacteraceae bacterium]
NVNPLDYYFYDIEIDKSKELSSKETYIYLSHQYELNYMRQFKFHWLNAMLQYRNYNDNVFWSVDSLSKVDFTGLEPKDDVFVRGSQALYGVRGSVLRSINSLVLNLNYNYKNKYNISALLNYERLKEGQYVSNGNLFKSLALNYDLSREPFLRMPEWVDEFSLYFNWGQAGNYPLNSLSNDLFSPVIEISSADSLVPGTFVYNLANHDLRPEKVTESNIGLEIKLLKERIILSADYYQKTNSDLLIKRTIPLYYGGGYIFQNIGSMKNSGYEVSLEVVPFFNETTYWSSKVGFSTNNQYITRLDEGVPITFNNTDVLIPDFVAFENEPLGAIYGYKYLGLWDDYYDPEYRDGHPLYVGNRGLAYERHDTVITKSITENDKTVIGNSLPDFTMNWINTFEYKNFSIDMFWYGVFGVDKYNATKASTFITGTNQMVKEIVLDTMDYIKGNVFYESSYFVEDASFIRLKTLSFTYRQKQKIAKRIQLEYTLNFENLITITNYSGYDPESAIYTNNNFTDNAIDKGAYPSPRGVYLSIKLNY